MAISFKVNGGPVSVDAPQDTPLLWVIREQLKLTGTKFGCGVGLCGACVVHIDGKRAFSCQTQISGVADKQVTTIEGLSPDSSHPVQKAWLAERVPQWGYCQSDQRSRRRKCDAGHPERREVSHRRPKRLHATIRRSLFGCRACCGRQLCDRALWRQDGPRCTAGCRQATTGIAQEEFLAIPTDPAAPAADPCDTAPFATVRSALGIGY
jgi:aerobic-type carbon monoxide dehydrogenase small subunit (CoxS/CutS family)